MTIQRSVAFNTFIETLIGIYKSNETERCMCSMRMFETLFYQHTKQRIESHTKQIIRNEMQRRGYKIVIGLDVCITKLAVVEVPDNQWPALLSTLVVRVLERANGAPAARMRFTLKQFQNLATIWPTAKAFEELAVCELKRVGLRVSFHANHVMVMRENPCMP